MNENEFWTAEGERARRRATIEYKRTQKLPTNSVKVQIKRTQKKNFWSLGIYLSFGYSHVCPAQQVTTIPIRLPLSSSVQNYSILTCARWLFMVIRSQSVSAKSYTSDSRRTWRRHCWLPSKWETTNTRATRTNKKCPDKETEWSPLVVSTQTQTNWTRYCRSVCFLFAQYCISKRLGFSGSVDEYRAPLVMSCGDLMWN